MPVTVWLAAALLAQARRARLIRAPAGIGGPPVARRIAWENSAGLFLANRP